MKLQPRIFGIVPLKEAVANYCVSVVERCDGNQSKAALGLRCTRGTLRRYVQLYDKLNRKHAGSSPEKQ